MFLSTNSLSIVYTFSWEYISISSHIVFCPLILQAFTNPMFLSTNSLSIVYTFSWEYISISSHIVVCPLFNITSVH